MTADVQIVGAGMGNNCLRSEQTDAGATTTSASLACKEWICQTTKKLNGHT